VIAYSRGAGAGRALLFSLTRTRVVFLFSLLLPAFSASAVPLCLCLEADGRRVATIPVTPASELRVSFSHSIYGSTVEEVFTAHAGSLQTERILYSEQRLAEFYGHESARYQNGAWVVIPDRRSFDALDLRVSSASSMSLSFDSKVIILAEVVEAGAAVRVTVVRCSRASDGK
jgi:hypothetical protein